MNIVQITPGAGAMFCGGCFRDNALVGMLRQLGHDTLMVPLYLPLTLEEPDNTNGTPIFYGGINVYLEQKSALFRHTPKWLHRLLDSPRLLKLVSGAAVKTRPQDVGDLTLSMLRGESGNQSRELDNLIAWLKTHHKPDVICLSYVLLLGLARRLKRELNTPIVCLMQGEDYFLNSLPPADRDQAWAILLERAQDVDRFIAPSQYFANLMRERLRLTPDRIQVVHNGINLEGYQPAPRPPSPPAVGFFARMCPEKGLDTLVDAFLILKKRDRVKDLKLRVGGGLGPSDRPFVDSLRDKMRAQGVLADAEFAPNLDKAAKQKFFQTLSVLSTPALYGEAFGLYVLEALASGVPVVQPRVAAFPELIEATGGGMLAEPNPESLALSIEKLLLDPALLLMLGQEGRKRIFEQFGIQHMAGKLIPILEEVAKTCRGARAH